MRVAADGRYVVFRARIADHPRALCDLLATVARTGDQRAGRSARARRYRAGVRGG
jgi:hypothetical protein